MRCRWLGHVSSITVISIKGGPHDVGSYVNYYVSPVEAVGCVHLLQDLSLDGEAQGLQLPHLCRVEHDRDTKFPA